MYHPGSRPEPRPSVDAVTANCRKLILLVNGQVARQWWAGGAHRPADHAGCWIAKRDAHQDRPRTGTGRPRTTVFPAASAWCWSKPCEQLKWAVNDAGAVYRSWDGPQTWTSPPGRQCSGPRHTVLVGTQRSAQIGREWRCVPELGQRHEFLSIQCVEVAEDETCFRLDGGVTGMAEQGVVRWKGASVVQ
jgi:hypothetical protein